MQNEVVGGGGLANFLQCSKGGKYFYSAARGGEFSYKLEERKVVASQFFLQCSKKGGEEECFLKFSYSAARREGRRSVSQIFLQCSRKWKWKGGSSQLLFCPTAEVIQYLRHCPGWAVYTVRSKITARKDLTFLTMIFKKTNGYTLYRNNTNIFIIQFFKFSCKSDGEKIINSLKNLEKTEY